MIAFFRSPPEAKGTWAETSETWAKVQAIRFMEEFCSEKLLPWHERIPLTRWERFKTYLPWSWSRNHETKVVYKAPKGLMIKWKRPLPFSVEASS